jgi:hypothetical protein
MKSLIYILLLSALIATSEFPQDKINNNVISGKFNNERLREIHNPNVDALQKTNEIDSLLLKSKNNTWQTALRIPQREFYEEEGFNAEDTRTTINKTLLGDGFLLIEEYAQFWDSSSSSWVNHSKDSYTYDGNNNQTEWLAQYWSGSNWRINWKYSYTYDGNNNQIEALQQHGNGSDWRNSWKYSYTYDGNNILTEMLAQHWSDSDWVNTDKCLYIHNGNNKPIEILVQRWNGFGWVISSKYSNKYDGNNNQTESLRQYWDDSVWVNIEKYSYKYDRNNNLTEYFYQYWNEYDSAWQNLEKYLYTYDENNKLTEELYQMGEGFVWGNFLKTFYTYDVNNNQIEALVYRSYDFSWVIYYKGSYSYDGNNNLIEELWQSWDGFDWVNFYKAIHSYIPTDVTEFTGEFNDYSLSNNFPNPFNPSTKIKYSIPQTSEVVIKIFDILGNEITTLVNEEKPIGNYELSWDATNLPSGIYFCRMTADKYSSTKKMILLK